MSRVLLILGIVLLVLWQWRRWRSAHMRGPDPAQPKTVEMVACAHCGTHLAAADAVSGRQGRYCSAEHRTAAER